MPVPFKVQKSRDKLPFHIADHIAVAWKDSILIWGGNIGGRDYPLGLVTYREGKSGEWITKTTMGECPTRIDPYPVGAQVLDDKLFVLGKRGRACVYSLDLNSWTWTRLSPTGNQPAAKMFDNGMTSWMHNGRIFCFGIRAISTASVTNLLFCYNTTNNAWEWPDQEGEMPSPRFGPATLIVGDTLFLFGGIGVKGQEQYIKLNDLYALNMLTMNWQQVHGITQDSLVPSSSWGMSLTGVSEATALLEFKVRNSNTDNYLKLLGEMWVLDLDKAKQLQAPSSIWTRIPGQIRREDYAVVVEPVHQRLWIIGGHAEISESEKDILEMTTEISSLKELAIERVASSIPAEDPRLECGRFPKMLRDQIKSYRKKI